MIKNFMIESYDRLLEFGRKHLPDKFYLEDAVNDGCITVDNLEPNPKNPIIAAFFRNIGYADQLGSGVRNLFKYTNLYSGKEPEFKEGDVFRIIVPLDEKYSFDYGLENKATGKSPDEFFEGLTETEDKH